MTTTLLTTHFVSFLGQDVSVSFDDADDPREVILYRPDPLSEDFVGAAIDALRAEQPESLARIEGVLISFEDRLGPTRRRIALNGGGDRQSTAA